MILHKLTLNNVGLFSKPQTAHLTPNNGKPLILIGGMNGTGKTTLLEAVRLCLYGRRALGSRVSQNEYNEFLAKMIHRNPNSVLSPEQASVSLEFEYARNNEKRQFRVERSWQRYGTVGNIKEVLTIYENDELNTEFDAEHWQDYLYELIPIGVSQFFFFDGEDIQKLTDDSTHDFSLAESIKALLGINLVERLQSDLRIYANRLFKSNSPEPVQTEIETIEAEIATLRTSLTDAEAHTVSLHTQIKELEAQIARQESRIAAEGGSYAEKRESLKLQQEQLCTEIEELENEIRDLCGELFPFALGSDLLKRLRKRLLKEIELGEWESRNRALKTQNKKLLETLESGTFWDDASLSESQIEIVRSKIAPLLKMQLERPEKLQAFKKKRDRSISEYNQLLKWIDACLNDVPQKFRTLDHTLREIQLEQQRVEQALQRAPDEDILKPMIENLSSLNQSLGQLRKQEQDADRSIRSLNYQLAETERKLQRLHNTEQLRETNIQRQKQVEDVQSVLSIYTTKLTETKIVTLGNAIVEGFNQLSHKPDRIKRVELDPRTFAVKLYDTDNQPLSKEELSAGEKQIYSTALLWGLAKTSGKALPMILDTPLGRLDSNHRQLLIERYFPYASHQVILLSTDTEIDKSFLSLLEPHLSHTLHLVYQQAETRTTIEDGYFGELLCD
ncbi:DNA sulfur modification protein DndD [Candidatus Poribacteria bacterium]|nr:MAG: DNA sulfur modification protein DndD [Candidatus Poribacteria bacterium]